MLKCWKPNICSNRRQGKTQTGRPPKSETSYICTSLSIATYSKFHEKKKNVKMRRRLTVNICCSLRVWPHPEGMPSASKLKVKLTTFTWNNHPEFKIYTLHDSRMFNLFSHFHLTFGYMIAALKISSSSRLLPSTRAFVAILLNDLKIDL